MTRTRANRYLQDRASMKDKTFSGIGYNFQAQDACVIEGAGKIQDRTKEHLVSSDKAIVAARKLLLKAIQDVKEGRDPLHVVRDARQNHFSHIAVISEVAPKAADIRAIVQQRIKEQRAMG
jgi:hypothetical protein